VTVHGDRRTAAAALARLADASAPSPGDRRVATTMTFTALLELWRPAKRDTLAASTVREYQRIIDTRLTPDLGAIHLDRLLPFHLDRYHCELTRDGLRAGSIRQVHAVVRGALGQAHRWGWLPSNSALRTRPPRRTKPDATPPTPAQVPAAAGRRRNGLARLRHARATRRRGRRAPPWVVRAAVWGHDRDEWTITIRTGIADVDGRLVETDTKSHRPRTISIDAATAGRLRSHHDLAVGNAAAYGTALVARAFVCSDAPDGSAPYRPDKATGTFRRVARRAGLGGARLHDLR
jgi:hypothetical protein